ncbi:PEP-CTERM sorting domain-containing protein [Meridianimarinicoccus roseus]|jgi:hypothetical protein|nr:PEP-CTERM sorting domain-containing protein [Meridianimarinicoccus roseus]
MLRLLRAAALLVLAAIPVSAAAATVTSVQMGQNDWIVLEFPDTDSASVFVDPVSVPGTSSYASFSYAAAFSGDGCGPDANQWNTWSCMPDGMATNVVNAGGGDFGYGWHDAVTGYSVTDAFELSYSNPLWQKVYVHLRVTSGNATVSFNPLAPTGAPAPAAPMSAIPVPAALPLLLIALGPLGWLAYRRRRQPAA